MSSLSRAVWRNFSFDYQLGAGLFDVATTLTVLIALGTNVAASYAQSTNFARFEQLKEPRITSKPN